MKHGSSGPGSGGDLPPSGPAAPAERLAAYLRTREGSLSTSTARALRADMQVFLEWCAERRFEALPARASTVAAFMRDMALQKAASTVRRYVYNLSTLHKALGEENPAEAAEVKLALRQLVPAKRGGENGVLGLTWPLCQRLIEVPGDRLIDSRNRALLAVAYDALLRRSELVSLQVAGLLVEGGASATLPAPRGAGDKDLVFHLASNTLRLVEVWLQRVGIKEGRLFRSLRKDGSPGEKLDASQVPRIFKHMALRAGLTPEIVRRLSGHSPRVGAAQDMIASGVQLPEILRVGRWKSAAMVQRYGERLLAEKSAAGRPAGTRPKDSFQMSPS